jgi:hypothetical protein
MPGFVAARYRIENDAGTHAPNDFYFPPLVEDKLRFPVLRYGDHPFSRLKNRPFRLERFKLNCRRHGRRLRPPFQTHFGLRREGGSRHAALVRAMRW